MLHKTQIGVCMDYSIAYLLEEKNEEKVITIIEADSEMLVNNQGDDNNNIRTGRKDSVFFKKVFEIVKDFDKVFLFGPVSAKNELLHRIKANKLLHIEIQNNPTGDKITENQKIDFINKYFDN